MESLLPAKGFSARPQKTSIFRFTGGFRLCERAIELPKNFIMLLIENRSFLTEI
jgi:hypothetical protein